MKYLNVPGYTNSGPDHWQSHLERSYLGFLRVEQDNWFRVDRDRWVSALDEAIRDIDDQVFLIGHSCGFVTIAQWAARSNAAASVVGALLVAPADVDALDAPAEIQCQRPMPASTLTIDTHVVVADDDPLLVLARGTELAALWGSSIDIVPGGGHLATADGYG